MNADEHKHTPGPWRHASGDCTRIVGSNGAPVAKIMTQIGSHDVPFEEHVANKNLIVSAPDLFFALEKLAEAYSEIMGLSRWPNRMALDVALAAIAKAKGTNGQQ